MDSQKNPGNSKVRNCCVSSGGGEERERTLIDYMSTAFILLLHSRGVLDSSRVVGST